MDRRETEKLMGNSTFLLYVNCSIVIADFTVGCPEYRIHLNYRILTSCL